MILGKRKVSLKSKSIGTTLPKIKDEFLPLVIDAKQLDKTEFRRPLRHERSNYYSVNENGELIGLWIEQRPNVEWLLLKECRNLKTLSIRSSKLSEIPEFIFHMPLLKVLDLSSNELKQIPDSISQLAGLERLDYSNNQLTNVPETLSQLVELKELGLRNNEFKVFPNIIFELSSIRHLSFEHNSLTTIPSRIAKLNKLEFLGLSHNLLSKLPVAIKKCKFIKELILNGNKFTEFPDIVCKLKSLYGLYLGQNQLFRIADSIEQLTGLTFLILSENQLGILPDNIKKLVSLRYLLLDNNQLTSLPNSIGELEQLRLLEIGNNKLTLVPESIKHLKLLNQLTLIGNPLQFPDPLFHELTPEEKIQTLIAIQNSVLKPLKQAKILVVGDERVGKTSVINRLLGNPHNDNQTTTQGIDISELDFGGFTTNIWDFAGQELTHQTHQFFLTERSLYVYVLDAQKEDNQARDLHWLNTIKSYSENSPIIVVVNHTDQNLNYRFDMQRYNDDFQIVDVLYTSACNLNTLSEQVKNHLGESIDKLRDAITMQLPRLPGIDRKLPENWHQIKNAMEDYKQTQNVIEKDVYESECQKAGISAKPLQTALLRILNSIGTVVAYPNDFRLKLTQILKPEWVTTAVYKIVRSVSDNPGIYSEDAIGEILNGEYSHTHQQWLVDLLIKFELGFRLPEKNDLLIPMRLRSDMPVFEKTLYQKGLNMRFNYHRQGLLKFNVLPQLIVRMHDYVDQKTSRYWRHGMFVCLNDCQGVIIADEPKQSIEIFLTQRNENARTLLQWIRSNLARVEESQTKASRDNNLPYLEEIALFSEKYSEIVGYTNYQRIERAHEKGRETINLEIKDPKTGGVDDKDFNVAELLGLYKDKDEKKFDPVNFTEFLIKVLLSLTELRAKIIDEQEDDINDRVRESLRSGGFSIADQSRGGFSGSGNGVGERDLVVRDQYGQQASIIEAMILKSAVKDTIESHYQKVVNHYNTQGNPYDFLITYAKVKNIEGLWKRYKAHINDIDDITDSFTDKLNIKVGSTTVDIDDSDHTREIIHILVNFGVKPE